MILRTGGGGGGNSLTGSISPDIGARLNSVFPAQMSASLPHSFSFLNRITEPVLADKMVGNESYLYCFISITFVAYRDIST